MRLFRSKKRRSPGLRNQTQLSSKDVYSYHARRSAADSGQRTTRPNKLGGHSFSWRQIPGLFALVVAVVCSGYLLSLNTNPKVSIIDVPGVSLLRPSSDYQAGASQILSSSFLNRTKVTISTAGFQKKMLERFPELSDASLTLPLTGHRPLVELVPARPVFVLATQAGQQFVVDARGRAVVETKYVKGLDGLHLKTVVDESKLSVEAGKGILGKNDVDFITTILQQLSAKKIEVASLSLPAVPSEVRLKLKGVNYYAKFNMLGDAREQAGALIATLDKLKKDSVTPAEYIDVRVEERVYYK